MSSIEEQPQHSYENKSLTLKGKNDQDFKVADISAKKFQGLNALMYKYPWTGMQKKYIKVQTIQGPLLVKVKDICIKTGLSSKTIQTASHRGSLIETINYSLTQNTLCTGQKII